MDQILRQVPRVIVRDTLSLLHRPVGQRRFVKAVQEDGNPKVAVGCRHLRIPGWICTDISFRAAAYLDLTATWPSPPGTIARIYGDNVIEHFRLPVARNVLKYAFEALKPGGRIRLVTPDVERTARAYLENPELTAQHLSRHRAHGHFAEHPVDLLRVTFAEAGHHLGYCFDFSSLSSELARVGFIGISRCEVGDSDDPDFVGLEQRVGPTERLTSLVVEAEKETE